MTDDTTRLLFCLIDGDSTPFKVTPNKGDISYLQQLIQEQRKDSVLRSVDPNVLVLWKLHEPELLKPNDTLVERIQSRGTEISQFAQRLHVGDDLLDVFPEQVLDKKVHILVQLQFAADFSNARLAGHREVDVSPPLLDSDALQRVIAQSLSEYRKVVKAYLGKRPHYPTWQSPSKDLRIVNHVSKLEIPMIRGIGGPSLLLHQMGVKIDPNLISEVFSDTAGDIRLINTSGSGKTRVLIEGLLERWGFYLTCSNFGGVGSDDMKPLMKLDEAPGFTQTLPSSITQKSPELTRNRRMARRSQQVLIARLLVLRMFLEEARKLRPDVSPDNYRDRWVYFQLQPTKVTGDDIFSYMTKTLKKANDEYLDDAGQFLSRDIRTEYLSSIPDFYIVLDEAQLAAKSCTEAFRSYVDPNQSGPLLQVIMHTFHDLRLGPTIISGTGLSGKIVSQAMEYRVAKQGKEVLTVSKIGAFDSESTQRTYIQRYLPSFYVDTPSGEALLNRAWDWLRGRHHFTATFVQMLLKDSLHSPHKLLNEYIYRLTGMKPSDSPPFADDEPAVNVKLSDYSPLMSFDPITDDSDRAGRLGEIICSWMLHQRVIALRDEERDWVEWGFARFADNNGDSVIIDEPLIISALPTIWPIKRPMVWLIKFWSQWASVEGKVNTLRTGLWSTSPWLLGRVWHYVRSSTLVTMYQIGHR